MNLNDIHRGVQKNRARKRLGRGIGSGQGKTAGRGHKGQWSHNGVSFLSIFQGGTMPLVRRIPKRGFNNRWAKTVLIVNVGDLNGAFKSGDKVTPETLAEANLVRATIQGLSSLTTVDQIARERGMEPSSIPYRSRARGKEAAHA